MARSLGLVGWVQNLGDGRVEVLAQGESDQLDRLVSWLWTGPAGAWVTGVESEPVSGDQTLAGLLHPRRPDEEPLSGASLLA